VNKILKKSFAYVGDAPYKAREPGVWHLHMGTPTPENSSPHSGFLICTTGLPPYRGWALYGKVLGD